MRIKAEDYGFKGYDDVADVECSVQVSIQGVNAKGEPVTGEVTTKLPDSEIQKIRDIIDEVIKEEVENLFAKMKANSKE